MERISFDAGFTIDPLHLVDEMRLGEKRVVGECSEQATMQAVEGEVAVSAQALPGRQG